MAERDWLETKERVRQATDIVDLVESYIPLRRQGRIHVGVCPWHDDTRPSLQINPERQSFRCYVCNLGGDIFSFVMQMEQIDFREAMKILAERAGIPLQPVSRPQAEGSHDKQTLYEAMAWAEARYHDLLLRGEEAEPARRYLRERGVSEASIEKFHLGFAPDRWDWLLKQAQGTPFGPKTLEKIGLAVPRSSGDGHYDRFRGRVIFSIRDAWGSSGRPIALGGRILPGLAPPDSAKYINSPETPLFSKNRQFYGLDVARETIAKQRNVVVVEGYTDCVIAHQFGVGNVVAVLGTALGKQHLDILRRFADSITLVLDGDEAGQRRTNELLELFVSEQVDLRILTLPENLDPCDFLIAHGSEAFGHLLADAVDALEHKVRTVSKGLDPAVDTHQANVALEEVLATLAAAPRLTQGTTSPARLREGQILTRLSRQFGPTEEQLRERLTALRRRKPASRTREPIPAAAQGAAIGPIDSWDQELLELILLEPEAISQLAPAIRAEDVSSQACRAIYAGCLELLESGEMPHFDRLMLEWDDPGMKNLLVRLDEQSHAKSASDPARRLRDFLENFRRRKEDAQHRTQITALPKGELEAGHEEEALDKFHKLMASLRTRQSRSEPTEG